MQTDAILANVLKRIKPTAEDRKVEKELIKEVEQAIGSVVAGTKVEPILREAEVKGWLTWDRRSIRLTEDGQRFLNDLIGLFISA